MSVSACAKLLYSHWICCRTYHRHTINIIFFVLIHPMCNVNRAFVVVAADGFCLCLISAANSLIVTIISIENTFLLDFISHLLVSSPFELSTPLSLSPPPPSNTWDIIVYACWICATRTNHTVCDRISVVHFNLFRLFVLYELRVWSFCDSCSVANRFRAFQKLCVNIFPQFLSIIRFSVTTFHIKLHTQYPTQHKWEQKTTTTCIAPQWIGHRER